MPIPASVFSTHSLKTRITLSTLVIFLASIWSLAYYASRVLRDEMQRLAGDQQYSVVSLIAADINHEMYDQQVALEAVAKRVSPAMLSDPPVMQAFIEGLVTFRALFNGGLVAYRQDGTAIAEYPPQGRLGINYAGEDYIAGALDNSRATFSKPQISTSKEQPGFAMAVPIRNTQGKVIGVLAGATDLSKPNFLDNFITSRYGNSGGFLLVAPQHRLIVSATDKHRIMSALPALGVIPAMDRFLQGDEGYSVHVNHLGVEVLVSSKRIPIVGWEMRATMPTAEAFAPIRLVQRRMLLATFFLTLLAAGLIWWILRRQLAPMTAAAKALAIQSALDTPLQPLPVISKDEIGDLIGGFNRVLKTLRSREEALKEGKDRLERIYQSVGDGIISIDQGQRIVLSNPVAARIFGYPSAEMIGMPLAVLLPARYRARHEEIIRRFAASEHPNLRMGAESQIYGLRASGEEFMLDATASQSGTAPNKLLTVILRDITERRKAEQAREQLVQKLELLSRRLSVAREEERSVLAYELHEELAQELMTLKIYLQMIDPGSGAAQSDNAQQKALALTLHAAERVRKLAVDLVPPELADFGLQAAARTYCEQTAVTAGWRLHFEASTLEKRASKAVERACFHVLQEALSNVLHHAQASEVWVQVLQETGELVLRVRDNGIGFDRNALGEEDTSEAGSLGLFEMQMRVKQVGGSMEMKSSIGAGTELTTRYPLSTDSGDAV